MNKYRRTHPELEEFECLCEDIGDVGDKEIEEPPVDDSLDGEETNTDEEFFMQMKGWLTKFKKLGDELEGFIRDPATPESVRKRLLKYDSAMSKMYLKLYSFTSKVKECVYNKK